MHLVKVIGWSTAVGLAAAGFAAEPPAWADRGSIAVVATAEEPGERFVLRGTVFAADGATPAPGVALSVFQTDASGRYTPGGTGPGNDRDARLRARVTTDARGRYELRTIVPGRYIGGGGPSPHIHIQVLDQEGRVRQDATVSFRDEILSPEQLREVSIAPWSGPQYLVRSADMTLSARWDIRLRP